MGDLKNVQLTDLDLDVREIDSNIDVEGGAVKGLSFLSCGGNQCSAPTIACNATKNNCQTACSACQTMGPCH